MNQKINIESINSEISKAENYENLETKKSSLDNKFRELNGIVTELKIGMSSSKQLISGNINALAGRFLVKADSPDYYCYSPDFSKSLSIRASNFPEIPPLLSPVYEFKEKHYSTQAAFIALWDSAYYYIFGPLLSGIGLVSQSAERPLPLSGPSLIALVAAMAVDFGIIFISLTRKRDILISAIALKRNGEWRSRPIKELVQLLTGTKLDQVNWALEKYVICLGHRYFLVAVSLPNPSFDILQERRLVNSLQLLLNLSGVARRVFWPSHQLQMRLREELLANGCRLSAEDRLGIHQINAEALLAIRLALSTETGGSSARSTRTVSPPETTPSSETPPKPSRTQKATEDVSSGLSFDNLFPDSSA